MSFQLETDEKSFAGSSLILEAVREIQNSYAKQKKKSKLTQQALADRLGIKNRSVVNKWLKGRENLSLRTIGELAWALDKKATIRFEDCDSTEGNFFDEAPHSPYEASAPHIINNQLDIEEWGRAPNSIQKSSAALENA